VDLNEVETRRRLIDARLRLAGWEVDDPSQVSQELDIDLARAGLLQVAKPARASSARSPTPAPTRSLSAS
jgi:type I site-specific restriction endonuclease